MSKTPEESTERPEENNFGAALKAERLRQGISLEEIARKTTINLANLRALENGERHLLPADVFCRGFIKIYAEALGIPADDSLAAYNRLWGDAPSGVESFYSNSGSLAEAPSLLADKHFIMFTVITALVASLFLGVHLFKRHSPPPNGPAPIVDTLDSPKDKGVDCDHGYTLTAKFNKRTWIKIQTRHGKPAEYTFRAGEIHTWQAREGFILNIDDPKGASLTLNGKALPLTDNGTQDTPLLIPPPPTPPKAQKPPRNSQGTESTSLSPCLRTGGTLRRTMPRISGTLQAVTAPVVIGIKEAMG